MAKIWYNIFVIYFVAGKYRTLLSKVTEYRTPLLSTRHDLAKNYRFLYKLEMLC